MEDAEFPNLRLIPTAASNYGDLIKGLMMGCRSLLATYPLRLLPHDSSWLPLPPRWPPTAHSTPFSLPHLPNAGEMRPQAGGLRGPGSEHAKSALLCGLRSGLGLRPVRPCPLKWQTCLQAKNTQQSANSAASPGGCVQVQLPAQGAGRPWGGGGEAMAEEPQTCRHSMSWTQEGGAACVDRHRHAETRARPTWPAARSLPPPPAVCLCVSSRRTRTGKGM